MFLQFILGRSGSGKSETCLEEIRRELLAEPDGDPIVLLVPEQASFLAEYALVTTPGLAGTFRAQVLSFRRLAYRILQETGGAGRQPIDDTGKKMLLYRILEKRKSELLTFQPAGMQPGLLDALLELIRELKRYGHSPEELACLASGAIGAPGRGKRALEDKLHDLELIYEDYEREMSSAYFDADDILTLAAGKLEEAPSVRRTRFWLDGFHGFTPQELQVIGGLMRFSAGVKVTLCLDREYGAGEMPHELDLFYPTARTMSRLKELAGELEVPVLPTVMLKAPDQGRFRASPALAHLEAHFQRPEPFHRDHRFPEHGEPEIRVVAAANRRAEIEGAAREMLRLARDRQARWRDMAVMVRNIEEYGPLVERIFDEYGIPAFMDQKRAVTHHPLIEFVRSALDAVMDGWRYDSVFRCVKTDFFLGLGSADRSRMDELENYVLAFGIRGRQWTSPERWTFRLNASLDPDGEDKAEPAYLERIHRSRMTVARPLMAFERRLRASEDVRGFAEAIVALLEEVQAARRLEQWIEEEIRAGRPEKAREHAQVWTSLMDALDQMVEVAGGEPVDLELFAGMLDAGLEGIRLGLVPPALDQVLVGSPDRTRAANIRYCFVLGANDGVYPARVPEGGILTEREREHLADAGLELAPGSRRRLLDDQFLIYSVLTMPSRGLWLSYPLADEEGKALRPAELIRRVKRMFPWLEETFVHLEPNAAMGEEDQAQYAVRPQQALTLLLTQLRSWMKGMEISPVWWDVYNWMTGDAFWREKLKTNLNALFYMNEARPLSTDMSRALYGQVLKAGVSRLEQFAACPFAHFASYGLRLKPRQVWRLEAPDVGQLFHAALGLLAVQLKDEGTSWGDLTKEECERRAALVVDQLAPRLQSSILSSSNRYLYISRKLRSIVSRASAVLGEQARRGDFVPVGLEVAFGPGAELPPLELVLDNGMRMEIVGRIDRVDKAETEEGLFVRIIDYKSSRTSLELADVYYGLSLQMLVYLDVVLTYAGQWLGKAAKPAGVLYFHVHQPLLQKKNAVQADEAEEELFRQYQMKGLVTADPVVVCAMDHGLGRGETRSAVIPVALKKDGGFTKSSSVVTPEQWERLRRYVRSEIRSIGTKITDGRVDILPYRAGTRTPCRFCEFKPVCQFDPEFEGNRYLRLRPGSDEEWWALMENAAGREGAGLEQPVREHEAGSGGQTGEGEGGNRND